MNEFTSSCTLLIALKAKEVLSLQCNIWGFHISREVGHETHSLQKERSWKIPGWLLKHEKDWGNIWNRNCGAIPQSNNGTGSGTIAWNNKWHSWGPTAVLEKFAVETLSNLNTKCFCGKCDRSINVWISAAYQCGMRSKKLCSVGWGESSSFIKHLSSGQLHYHNTELLYHETNILPQKDSLVDRLGILCIVCKFCLCTTAGFKKGER